MTPDTCAGVSSKNLLSFGFTVREVLSNARTDRRGRPVASELETDVARPRSVQ
ncbi:MAG: hypothetical protein RIS76_1592 [Verrucomicrobiota bacterium]|jgi:hypothetical protein